MPEFRGQCCGCWAGRLLLGTCLPGHLAGTGSESDGSCTFRKEDTSPGFQRPRVRCLLLKANRCVNSVICHMCSLDQQGPCYQHRF